MTYGVNVTGGKGVRNLDLFTREVSGSLRSGSLAVRKINVGRETSLFGTDVKISLSIEVIENKIT
jgi:hypothetical protein